MQRRYPRAPCSARCWLLCLAWLTAASAGAWAGTLDDARRACQGGDAASGLALLAAARERDTAYWLVAARCHAVAGNRDKQRAALERADAEAAQAGDAASRVGLAATMAELQFARGEAEAAVFTLDGAIATARERGMADALPELLLARGNILARAGEYASAEEQFAEVIGSQGAFAAPTTVVDARLNRARTLLRLQRARDAAVELDAARAALAPEQVPSWRARRLATLGELYYRLDKTLLATRHTDRALAALDEANALSGDTGDRRTSSQALGYMGAVAEQFGLHERALAYSRGAADLAREANALDLLYLWQWQSARALEAMGESGAAAHAYQLAIDSLERVRPVLSGPAGTFNAEIAPLYFDAADLMLKQHADSADAGTQQASLRLVRDTVERFKVAEIQDYFGDECVVGDVDEAEADLVDDSVALVYPILFQERMEVLTSIGGRLYRHTADVSRREVGRTARDFRRGLVRRPTHRYRAPGKKLYDWLVAPAMPALLEQGVETLVFVADGALRTIPPGALYDGEKFLVESFAIATSPGLSLTSPRALQATEVDVLASGLTEARDGFSALPAVENELDMIRNLYGGTELRNERFLMEPVADELSGGRYSVVHIATHGQFKADYRDSFLLTYDGRMTMDALEETVGMRRFLNQPVELLMLSACETAVGDDRAALGLAGVALKAGARSAVASLWSINDQSSAELVGAFYANLKTGKYSRARTLQLAQLSLLQDERYDHPFYWSAFLLIGNWL